LLDNSVFFKNQNNKITDARNSKRGKSAMAKKLNKNGKVSESRHFLDLTLDTGKNGDEIDELLTIAVSRNELKMLCGLLQEIGDRESWLKLCLSVRLEYLTDKEKTWEKTNLFSVAYNDEFFGEWVTIRVLRSALFYPLYLLSLQKLSQERLSPEMCNECVDMFQTAGWPEAIRHFERKLGLDSSQIFDRILRLDAQKAAPANVFAKSDGN
jgi:hypothetical protein